MSRFLPRAIVLWVLAFVPVAESADIDFGTATAYTGFFFRNVTAVTRVDGRLAVGGTLSVHSTTIGAALPTTSTQPSLIVGGNILAFDGGSILAGANHPHYGLYAGSKAAGVPASLDLRASTELPFDFAAERDYLSALSAQVKKMAPTGTVTKPSSTVTLTGSNKAVEVFNMPNGYMVAGATLALSNIAANAYIVINVDPDMTRTARLGGNMSVLQGKQQRVLFNFYDAEVVTMQNAMVSGSVLAPHACICGSSGLLTGNVVADSWNSAMFITYAPFIAIK